MMYCAVLYCAVLNCTALYVTAPCSTVRARCTDLSLVAVISFLLQLKLNKAEQQYSAAQTSRRQIRRE